MRGEGWARPRKCKCTCSHPGLPQGAGPGSGKGAGCTRSHSPRLLQCVWQRENSRGLWARCFWGVCPGLGSGDMVVTKPVWPPRSRPGGAGQRISQAILGSGLYLAQVATPRRTGAHWRGPQAPTSFPAEMATVRTGLPRGLQGPQRGSLPHPWGPALPASLLLPGHSTSGSLHLLFSQWTAHPPHVPLDPSLLPVCPLSPHPFPAVWFSS